MPTALFVGTNHTSFTVRSLDRSIPFFVEIFGFEVTSRALREPKVIETITGVPGAEVEIAYLRGPDHTIELIEYLNPPDRGEFCLRPCDVGFAHIAFDVSTVAEVITAAELYGVVPIAPRSPPRWSTPRGVPIKARSSPI